MPCACFRQAERVLGLPFFFHFTRGQTRSVLQLCILAQWRRPSAAIKAAITRKWNGKLSGVLRLAIDMEEKLLLPVALDFQVPQLDHRPSLCCGLLQHVGGNFLDGNMKLEHGRWFAASPAIDFPVGSQKFGFARLAEV